MNTLLEHAVAMLTAVDEQSKIPGTVFRRCAWIVKDGETYSMCAAGAWYAQTYGRIDLPIAIFLQLPQETRDTMAVIRELRSFDTEKAYRLMTGRTNCYHLPYFMVDNLDWAKWDAEWRATMDKYVTWLTKHNL